MIKLKVELFVFRHHIVLIGTFENFVRDGVPNNHNIFKNNRKIQSIRYLLPWVRHVGDDWMRNCKKLMNPDFTGVINRDKKTCATNRDPCVVHRSITFVVLCKNAEIIVN